MLLQREWNGTCGPLTTLKRSKFNHHTVKKRFLFMMHKKLSMVRFRYRIIKSPKLRARGKTCKLRKIKPRWVKKATRDHQETLQWDFESGLCNWFSYWKSKSSHLWNRYSLSDMNNNTPKSLGEENEICAPEICHTQDALPSAEPCSEGPGSGGQDGGVDAVPPELRVRASPEAEALHQVETNGALSENHCSDIFVPATEKQIAVSDQDGAESKEVMGVDGMTLSQSSVQDSVVDDNFANGPLSMELTQNEDSSSQMEVEGSLDIFSSKLLDHPYCKSPLEEPSPESTGLKSGTRKGGKRNSQKASRVTDEQLATWLCGFLDEVMKKYGSLVPLCEKDVMGRLKEVFNEDFSHRKPFITREIMKYREKHPKPSTCNFRVFYNKHMLDMDDLATLEGQNWLNDQIINMYGELVMDAVPEKVHFFNSFFHRQLVTKGYNGVKRWTKKVDLFKKTLLLIPIHLEVHWSLITVNIPSRIISFYDSQGIHFKFCVENIRKYLLTEAKEKNRPEFLQGWQTAVTKCIPQQKNDSDCGVFVLQETEDPVIQPKNFYGTSMALFLPLPSPSPPQAEFWHVPPFPFPLCNFLLSSLLSWDWKSLHMQYESP
ncbi:sentrin-specific protease 5 isoform X1 [Neopelma chrysocephalum]|uniref:sentrin-specific protease 5 isoform X1 n=1 Tax=Neopelma chrysocephalum TaxID=114329 RepID=UPI000FCCFF9A|nr:sentrin-specific protease 5 isoform X1 [Neopelma chrysocephalum]